MEYQKIGEKLFMHAVLTIFLFMRGINVVEAHEASDSVVFTPYIAGNAAATTISGLSFPKFYGHCTQLLQFSTHRPSSQILNLQTVLAWYQHDCRKLNQITMDEIISLELNATIKEVVR
jgi:hypothetical protein